MGQTDGQTDGRRTVTLTLHRILCRQRQLADCCRQLMAYYNCDTSTIRLRFDYDSTTIRLQHATRFFVRSHTRSYTRISGRRVLHVDWQLNAHSFYCILYIGLPYIVCVSMPEIVYTKAIKCQYAEYTINHCEIIVMRK